jgi:hypothetical protein
VNKTILMLTAALTATGLNAQTTEAPGTPGVIDIALSPSGKKVVYIVGGAHSTEAVYVAELAETGGTPKPILVHPDEASELRRCRWANEERMICRLHFSRDGQGNPQDFSRIFAMTDKGQEFVILTAEDIPAGMPGQIDRTVLALAPEGKQDKILMSRNWVPQFVTTTRVSQDDAGLGVEEVDLASGTHRRIEQPDLAASAYAADEAGKIRFKASRAFGAGGPRLSYFYREAQSDRWHEMTVKDAGGNTVDFRPVAVDSAKNLAYGFITVDGHQAPASLTLEGEGRLETLLHRTDAEVGGFVAIGTRQRVIGAAYAGESADSYFDEGLRDLVSGLESALPDKPRVSIVGSSADGNRLLIVAQSEGDAGLSYLFERSTRQLSEIMPVRPPDGRIVGGV